MITMWSRLEKQKFCPGLVGLSENPSLDHAKLETLHVLKTSTQ